VFFVPLWFNPELSGLFNSQSLATGGKPLLFRKDQRREDFTRGTSGITGTTDKARAKPEAIVTWGSLWPDLGTGWVKKGNEFS
jgi:hypothetical protein